MTKPEIARDLITAALDTGIPCGYVLADALYGSDKSLRVMLERREQPHVLAVRSKERLMAGSFQTRTAAEIADAVPAGEWQRLAAGEGAKGPRLYDWALVRLFRRVRKTMGQLAWLWLRNQPGSALSAWYRDRVRNGRGRIKRIAIRALARKLLVALWRFVTQGLVPIGALLKAAKAG